MPLCIYVSWHMNLYASLLLLLLLTIVRKWLWQSWCACGVLKIFREIVNSVRSTPSGKPIQLCLHIDNYRTESFVFKFNLTSFATHRRSLKIPNFHSIHRLCGAKLMLKCIFSGWNMACAIFSYICKTTCIYWCHLLSCFFPLRFWFVFVFRVTSAVKDGHSFCSSSWHLISTRVEILNIHRQNLNSMWNKQFQIFRDNNS